MADEVWVVESEYKSHPGSWGWWDAFPSEFMAENHAKEWRGRSAELNFRVRRFVPAEKE